MAMTMPSRTKAANATQTAAELATAPARAHLRVVPQPVTTRCEGAQRDGRVNARTGRAIGRGRGSRDSGAVILAGLSLVSASPRSKADSAERRVPRPRRPQLRAVRQASVTELRITRRGRRVLGVAAILVIAAAAALALLRPAAAALPSARLLDSPRTVTVSVQPGQTLWQIAREYRPDVDPRDAVIELRETNNLISSQVSAGQQLIVPLDD